MNKKQSNRRNFLKILGVGSAAAAIPGCAIFSINQFSNVQLDDRPNIVLVMADDLGFGDVAYNGNKVIKTPNLDKMAKEGIRFDRFYAAAPVCSPTRASCLTGRHPYRSNIPWAGERPLPSGEITIAEALKTAGYATGHFGKWHVGTLSKTVKQSYFKGQVDPATYSPPWENGFDECFSTESMMPTYNPYYHVGGDFEEEGYRFLQDVPVEKGQRTDGFRWRDHYWTGEGKIVDEWLEGDDSKIIMDRALEFMNRKSKEANPFLSLVWFHTPHTPVVAGNKDRKPYSDQTMDAQHWYGAISAMDKQVGRLHKQLKKMGIAENTIVWFCSDNGPSYIHNVNSAGPLRGKKATLWEGGIRVPASMVWPAKFKEPKVINTPIVTSDFYPTLLKAAGAKVKNQPTLDGIDVMPILEGKVKNRSMPIFFQSPVKKKAGPEMEVGKESYVVIMNDKKLSSFDSGNTWQLYDLGKDIGEQNNIIDKHPVAVEKMQAMLKTWQKSVAASAACKDYR